MGWRTQKTGTGGCNLWHSWSEYAPVLSFLPHTLKTCMVSGLSPLDHWALITETIDYRQYNTKYNSKFDVRLLTDLKRVLSVAARKVICNVIQFVNSGLYRKQAA